MASFRDRFLTPKVARAITSPSAIIATGAGVAVGIVAFGNPIGAVALGVGAFAARVLAAVPRAPRRSGVNPRELDEPWRSIIQDVLDARRRFDTAIANLEPGPLQTRLSSIGDRLHAALEAAWRTAKAGQLLSEGRRQIDTDHISAELAAIESAPPTSRTDQTLTAIRAQLASAHRLDATIADAYDRLRLLDARIDETITRTVELSVTQVDPDALSGLGNEVESIVGDMEALRQAVEETRHDPNLPDPAQFGEPRTGGGGDGHA